MAIDSRSNGDESRLLVQHQSSTKLEKKKRDDERCSVFFNFVNGKTLCMMVNVHEEEISTIKKRLVAKLSESSLSSSGASPSFVMMTADLFLMWNGKPLDDDYCVLADYNFGGNNRMGGGATTAARTIVCQQRQRGGCFAVSFSVFVIIVASILGSTLTCGTSLILVPLLLPLLVILPFCCL